VSTEDKERVISTELFEFNGYDDTLSMLNQPSTKEHDLPPSGFDFLKAL
jgi:hypothetical protein